MGVLMCCLGLASGGGTENVGKYLQTYDPDYANGRGIVTWTGDPAKAIKFATAGDLFRHWKLIPASRPVREDGKPNRPLTAFSITPIDEDRLDDPRHIAIVQCAKDVR